MATAVRHRLDECRRWPGNYTLRIWHARANIQTTYDCIVAVHMYGVGQYIVQSRPRQLVTGIAPDDVSKVPAPREPQTPIARAA